MKAVFFLLLLVNLLFFLWEKNLGQSKPNAAPPIPAGVEKLTLAPQSNQPTTNSSTPPQATPEPVKEPAPAASPEPTPPAQSTSESSCQRIGPFDTQNQTVSFQKKLKSQNLEATPVKIPTNVETGYILVYPPAPDLETAQTNRKMLESKGLKGSWVINEGANQFGVTVAFLNSKQKADTAVVRYQSAGLNLLVIPKLSPGEKWWLELKGVTDASVLIPSTLASQLKVGACQ